MSKFDNKTVPIMILLKRVVANEKIRLPRLQIFEKIVPSLD